MIKFTKFSRKQRMIFNWWTDESPVKDKAGIIADGSIRSGKTTAMGLSFVMWSMEKFDGQNFAICGHDISSIRRNVVDNLKESARGRGYKVIDHVAKNCLTISKADKSNEYYLFGGKDESSQNSIQGITLAGIMFDEVALMPQSFVNQATARCSVEGSKYWFNCNPGSPEHWFNKEWLHDLDGKNMIHIHFMMDDNLSLSEEKKRQYYATYKGVFYQRFILGKWCVAEGAIYDMFNKEKHVRKIMEENYYGYRNKETTPEKRMAYVKSYVSIDYGTQNATVFLKWRKLKDGNWYCEKEYYYSGREKREQKTDEEYVKDLLDFIGGNPNSVAAVVVDPSAASFIAALRKAGFQITKAKNDVLDGIRITGTYLNRGKLIFDPSCVNTQKEFAAYLWDEKAVARGEDKPLKTNDHAMDAMRYFVMTVAERSGPKVASRAQFGL